MAEENKPVEVPKEEPVVDPTVAAVAAPAEEAKEEPAAPAATEAAATTSEEPAAAATEAAPAEEAKKEEPTPVEDGHLEHKGSNFPKNFIYSKKYFWFGADAVDPKTVPALLKDHALAAWAAQTGEGLLFFSEKSADKSAPHGAIPLAEAAEPVSEGTNKFHFTAKGHKHTFKAPTAAERDNWVAQLKTKIAAAKELATTVTESETYKTTLASFKPAPPAPKEKKSEEAPAAAAAPATEAAAPAEETPKEPEAPTEPAKEEVKKEAEEPKRRSASRKRGSIFGNLLGKKEEKKEEKKEAEAPVAEAPAEAPVESAAAVEETPKEPEVPAVPAETEAAAPATEEATKTEETKPAEKPTPSKRNSIFGNLSFGKKKHEEAAPKAKEPEEPVADAAPVIPAPEPAGDLSAEVSSPATVPTETVEVPPATNGETKKEVKSDKRKSSLPAIFGKKAAAEEGEASESKPKSPNPFSKFRATIKGKGKTAEKPAEKAEDKPAEATEAEAKKEGEPEAAPAAPAAAPAEEENKPAETPLQSTPAVTAAA